MMQPITCAPDCDHHRYDVLANAKGAAAEEERALEGSEDGDDY